ncbi:MAG TPA: hypothetical protein PLE19_07985 [Planctomycetota bacterium]|nr:hypothetical protein [Planctomycetota bacterium]HRR81980.1 hypothetical protein [Planctomycetota bacterium]HRT97056.1 hypothetical protein [Planctomycetota bacterium]
MRPTSATTLRRWMFAGAALAFAIVASQVQLHLQRRMEQAELRGYAGAAKVPPAIEFATKTLGCFRALAIIGLWVRSSDLQEAGKFFELNDLFRMISQLEPRFPGVWAYWAWNVAYNCSVKFPASQPEERWRWIKFGIEILRDEGIPINPKAPTLYRELAWIYNHKIGGDTDDAHIYYKVQLALETEQALGKPPYLDRLKAMAAAPPTERELLNDPAVRVLVDALRAAGVNPFSKPLEIANRAAELPAPVLALLNDPANADAAGRLEAYLRAANLRDRLKLDTGRMIRLMDFGPIDWRLPDAHSLYWAGRSVEIFGTDAFAAANSDRMLFHSLSELYRRGRLRFEAGNDEEPDTWVAAPNFGFIESIIRLHQEIVARHAKSDWAEPTREGYLNFLRDVVVNLYVHNDVKNAARYFKMLLDLGGETPVPLQEFVYSRYTKLLEAMTTEQALNLIRGFLFRSLMWASLGDNDQAAGEDNLARYVYNKYREERVSPRIRAQIPPLRTLWLDALREALRSFRRFQVDELRRLYPTDVKAIEDEFKKLAEEEAAKRAAPEGPPAPIAPKK